MRQIYNYVVEATMNPLYYEKESLFKTQKMFIVTFVI